MRNPEDYATQPSHDYASDTHFVVEQHHPGGIKRPGELVKMRTRRVVPSGCTEELQIEIEIASISPKRVTRKFGSLILTPELADQLAKACAEIRKK